ncbi:MAG: hypothetical protein CML66_25395 [Rhodobacteraceae bacterium]|nr:hypothetical protein [Paracoccaceae bacterium]
MRATLEIFDLATGRAQVLLDTDRHIEAPNWAPDGSHLLVNAAGRLFRVDLADPALVDVDTGKHGQLNNDHGISPDGQWVALSDKTETGDKSCIYVMPASGGTPRRVTDKVPSWYHGWTPDGGSITYTCVRDGRFGIATLTLDTLTETVVTTADAHFDGPDYTPDGAWIWFNSDQGGSSDLWRIRPDGTDAQQMTHATRVEWFPHPSPDGRHVLYLSYPPGTENHPFGLSVELRLMPAEGGPARVLLPLFGGQGTLNVPCWAPDSSRFAFVRYYQDDQE